MDLYATLDVSRDANEAEVRCTCSPQALGGSQGGPASVQIRRQYRRKLTRHHPDKGGDTDKFNQIQKAYEVLSDPARRSEYDRKGTIEHSVEDDLRKTFAEGAFHSQRGDEGFGWRNSDAGTVNLSEQLIVHEREEESHTAGLDAFLRAAAEGANKVINAETLAQEMGVTRSSYEPVPLPSLQALCARVQEPSFDPSSAVKMESLPIPPELGYGELLIQFKRIPIEPHTIRTGRDETGSVKTGPFVPGNEGVAIAKEIGPGVRNIADGDWLLPFKPSLGTWRSLAVVREKDIMKVPVDLVPMENAATVKHMATAYRLLEDHGQLRPGDAVALNGCTSVVGQAVIQLCKMLRLRAICIARDCQAFDRRKEWLRSLGATAVLKDKGDLSTALAEENVGGAKPKLGLDCVGSDSSRRLAELLADGSDMVVYGCMSGESPRWPWQAWVFKSMVVRGFNLRRWLQMNKSKVPAMLETIAKLVRSDKLGVDRTEYGLSELMEALEHHETPHRCTKIVLTVDEDASAVPY